MENNDDVIEIVNFSNQVSFQIINYCRLKPGAAYFLHIGGALSIADIVSVLFKYQI